MFSRRLIIPLAFVVMMQLAVPAQVSADPAAAEPAAPIPIKQEVIQAPTLPEAKITLEEAIQITRKNFNIPQEFSDFSSGFNNYGAHQSWSLNWRAPGTSGGNFSSQIDAVTGEIINLNFWQPVQETQSYKLPKLSLSEARVLADNLVKKYAGEKYAQLKFVEENNIIPIDLYGQSSYAFRWQRTQNGLDVQGNGANIQIDANSGQLMSYNLNWDSLTFPGLDKIIDAKKAAEAFSLTKQLEIQYFLSPVYRPLTAADSKEQVQLVYQLKNYGTIDAFTGKPLVLDRNQWLSTDSAAGGMGSSESASSRKLALTPQEEKEIAENANLLSKESAIEIVKKWVEIPETLRLKGMNLYKDSSLRNGKIWSFEWGSQNQSLSQSIYARVNALSGEIIGFNCYGSPDTPGSQNTAITKEEAKTIAEDFLKKIQPDKFRQVQLNADAYNAVENSKIPAETSSLLLSYQRIVNGILFPSNQMSVTVNLLTKKITSYDLTWWDLDFPQLSQALPQTQAEEIFLQSRPLQLQYVILYDQGDPKEFRLVYQPSVYDNQTSNIMDAKTGLFLDWQGKPLKDQLKAYSFNDISGLSAEKEIKTLGLAGVFGEYGTEFRPRENITVLSLLKALLTVKNGTLDTSLPAEEILKQAKELQWVQEELLPSQTVSKELFAKIIIRYLGLEKIAAITGIFIPYTDIQSLPAKSQGSISLSVGLGILSTQGANFQPEKAVTREEAAAAIIKALEFGFRS